MDNLSLNRFLRTYTIFPIQLYLMVYRLFFVLTVVGQLLHVVFFKSDSFQTDVLQNLLQYKLFPGNFWLLAYLFKFK